MLNAEEENLVSEMTADNENEVEEEAYQQIIDIEVVLPSGKTVEIPRVSTSETLNSIRLFFVECQETSFITSYQLKIRSAVNSEGADVAVTGDSNEYVELATLLQPTVAKVVIDLINEDYDVKKVHAHVKRTRDAITYPPLTRNPSEAENVDKEQAGTKDSLQQVKDRIRALLPKAANITDRVDLGRFYQETLLRTGKAEVPVKSLSDTIKSVNVSGWNPPPPNRKLQGDLMYLEVATASEGTFHITATLKGFYVNKCNRNHFDPAPSVPNAPVSHDLFTTLLGVSASLRAAWAKVTAAPSSTPSEDSGPLDLVATLYAQGRGDQSSATPQWNTLPSGVFSAENSLSRAHTYDLFRAMEAANDLHGIDELGAPREWNDEIQALRSLAAGDLADKAMKAKLEHKILTEFTEACKLAAVAISDGHIAPITYADPSQSEIYVYNGIFFSKAEDNKDSFKVLRWLRSFFNSVLW